MVTRTYRLDHDLGFAPNPYFRWCTLACCMPLIREHALIGDVIVGMAGANRRGLGRIHPQVIYWMRVDEALSFDDYWRDPRFLPKRPSIPGPKSSMVGDRTYRHDVPGSDWSFETSMHYMPGIHHDASNGHVAKDTRIDRMLVGKHYTYWGGDGPRLPDRLIELFPIRNQKCPKPSPLLDELHELIGLDDPRGLAGTPADWDNPRYFV